MLKNGILDVFARLVIVVFITMTFSNVVVLEPKIDRFFFFAADDPASIEAGKVDKLFSEQNQVVVSARTSNISSAHYYQNIKKLSNEILKINGVKQVQSLSHGPKNYKDASQSPVWSSFLLDKEKHSSLIVINLKESQDEKKVVPLIEKKVIAAKQKDFILQMSGMPYMVEKIRVHLLDDMKIFSSSAIAIFGLLLLVIFGSFRILLGTMATCATAIMGTLIAMTYFDISLGILTANLSTIVFILTQSHIIFLTSNWQRLGSDHSQSGRELAMQAIKRTFNPSFWCMITTLLGFLSLILVPAKPLKDLGLGGAIGTVTAILAAYIIYPAFLNWTKRPQKRTQAKKQNKIIQWLSEHKFRSVAFIAIFIAVILGQGIYKLDVDPGLHEYFAKDTELRKGLEDIDRSGGSSILSFVVSNKSGAKLNDKASYKRMWQLQKDLNKHPAVGSNVSLAHLIAESDRHPLSFFVPIHKRLNMMASAKFDHVANGFISKNHKQGHFIMRMIESKGDFDRGQVITELKAIANKQGFNVDLIGGVYYLQEELSSLIQASIIKGISMLLLLFLIIAYIVSRSIVMSISMVLGLSLIPLSVLGLVGSQAMPLDIFATPAVNVCIGIAVDTMIHLAIAVRLHAKQAQVMWQDWVAAREEQFGAILISTGIVASGFSIFLLSYFPPTYRFGIQVVIGTLCAAIVALIVFPAMCSTNCKKEV